MSEVRKGFSWFSLAALVLAIMACFGIGWSAFVKPTTTNEIAGGGVLNQTYNYDVPSVPIGGCALWRVNIKAYWQKTPDAGGQEDKL